MRKTKMMLLGVLLATAGASWTATAAGIDQYALKEFTADFTQFHIGDTVPAMYLTPEYNIKQWQQRNLPAPDAEYNSTGSRKFALCRRYFGNLGDS